LGLSGGLALGAALGGSGSRLLETVLGATDLVGQLFVNGIRMTVLPLIVSSLVAGVASWHNPRGVGRLLAHALAAFVVAAAAAATFATLVAWPLLPYISVSSTASSALRSATTVSQRVADSARESGVREWVGGLISPDPFEAASDGAVLPLVVFALLIGLALMRIDATRRSSLVSSLEAVRDAMLVLVGWVLACAPVGVFALALSAGARLGVAAFASVLSYVLLVVGITVAFVVLVLFPAANAAGFSWKTLIRGLTPALSLAFSSRSTMATLPAMMAAASRGLALAPEATACLIPLAASLSRVGGAVGQVVGVLFLATLYGVDLTPSQLPAILIVTVVTTFAVPGVPGGSIIAMVPVLAIAGVPPEGLGILLGVDAIPDMFRTAANVSGGILVAGLAARQDERRWGSSQMPAEATASRAE
jgi:Na+/H+-dicarboxylate symporter